MVSSIFPWVETEEQARQERRQELGKRGEDIALKNLLSLLIHLRVIILQDAAVLSVKYPDCAFFQQPPFSTLAFRDWASSAATVIDNAEEQSRLRLEVFPEHVVQSLRGILNEGHITQQLESQATQTRQHQIQAELNEMKGLLEALVPLASRRRPRPLSATPTSTSSRSTSTVPTAPTLGILVPSLHPGVVSSSPNLDSSTQSPPTATATAITRCGTVYSQNVFPLSQDPHEREQQIRAIDDLESKFTSDRLKNHLFEWKVSNSEWLPHYQWWKPNPGSYPSIEQIWTEHELGMDGKLSIRELSLGWDARWKRNKQNIKSEYSRRMKIVGLVQDLAAKPNWNSTKALKFLAKKYHIPTSTTPYLKSMRAFIEHLQKAGGAFREEILNSAMTYST